MPDPTPPPAPAPPGQSAAPPPAPAPPVAETVDTVNVRVGYPHAVFQSGVEGVPDITTEFVAIPASALQAVKTAAVRSRVKLIEEKS